VTSALPHDTVASRKAQPRAVTQGFGGVERFERVDDSNGWWTESGGYWGGLGRGGAKVGGLPPGRIEAGGLASGIGRLADTSHGFRPSGAIVSGRLAAVSRRPPTSPMAESSPRSPKLPPAPSS
jgi:hypothetical protein